MIARDNVFKMLDIGEACELKTAKESYTNMMNHTDAFFNLATISVDHKAMCDVMLASNILFKTDDGFVSFNDLTLNEARQCLKRTVDESHSEGLR
jgi:hypothetical protein